MLVDVADEDVDRARIVEGLGSAGAAVADIVLDPSASIQELPASFMRRARLFEVEKFRPTRPTLVYIGLAQDGAAFLLNQRPDQFHLMVAHAGAQLDGPADAVELARTFVHVTRPQNRRYLLVASVDELPWMPGLEGDAAKRADEQRHALTKILVPPGASPKTDGWDVDLFVVDGNSLDRLIVHVRKSGRMETECERLFDELSLAYAL